MSKRKADPDYDPVQAEQIQHKKPKVIPKVRTKTKEQAQTFLTTHADEVVSMHQKGMKPTAIATSLCLGQGLREGAVTGKQVSNWIYYHKKAKKIKTRSVCGKNGNLRADDSDQAGWQKDLNRTAKEDGIALEEDDEDFIDESDEADYDNEMEIAGKYFRFFEQHDEKKYVLFVELGIHRTINVRAISDFSEIELKVQIPLPPDELFHKGGFPNASQVNIKPTEEIFILDPPKKVTREKETKVLWPNDKVALYAIFTWQLAEDQEEPSPTIVDNDLTPLLFPQVQEKKIS
jgi:hypothetical protein